MLGCSVVVGCKSIDISVLSFSRPFMFVGDTSGDGAADHRVRSDSEEVVGRCRRFLDCQGEKSLTEF